MANGVHLAKFHRILGDSVFLMILWARELGVSLDVWHQGL